MSKSIQQGLVFNPERCSLLVFSSNYSASQSHQHNTDKDAESIFAVLKGAGLVRDSKARLVTTMEDITKQGLEKAIKAQIQEVPSSDEEGLFIFVYCGGGCDLQTSEPDEDGFVLVKSEKSHFFVLKEFELENAKTHVSGGDVADMIINSSSKPKQMLVILDCPFAQEISEDLEKCLKGRLDCDLTLIVSQEKNKTSHYLSPLGLSTFSFFFSKFLSEESAKSVGGTHATLYLKSMHTKLGACCDALSSLKMVRDDCDTQILTSGSAHPEARFAKIVEEADKVMERIELTETEQVDGEETGMLGKFLEKYYKSGFFTRSVRLCDQAKDFVQCVLKGHLLTLSEHGVLANQVLAAAVGAMMATMATIQSALNGDCISNSNIFIKSYVYVFAAVSMHVRDLDIADSSLLKAALEFYMEVVHAKKLNEINLIGLKMKMELV